MTATPPFTRRATRAIVLCLVWVSCACLPAAPKEARGPGTAEILQFFVDPTLPDQGWIVTANSVQANPGLKTGGHWAVKFDREIFQKVTGVEPRAHWQVRRIQASQARRGAVLLLIENIGDAGEPYVRYVFLSLDAGDTWTVSQKGSILPKRAIAEKAAKSGASPAPAAAAKLAGHATNPAAAPAREASPSPSLTPGGEPDAAGARLGKAGVPMRIRMDSTPPAHGTPPSGVASGEEKMLEEAGRHPAGVSPLFNLLFDLWLDARPGVSPLTFDNYHTLVLLDLHPSRDLQFSAEVSPSPRYYEITYRATPRLEFRGGRIWIPFDEMNPHEIYGGFYNIDRLREPGSMAFLPELWTDLGLALKYRLISTRDTKLELQAYVVNGFGDGQADPLKQVGTRYPNFDGSPTTDNNADKAVGLRLHGSFDRWLGVGASFYEGRYTGEHDLDRRLWMLGADLQVHLGRTDLKSGYVLMNVDLPPPSGFASLQRNGFYLELTERLTDRWRLIGRGGSETDDSRVVTVGNRTLLGGELVYSYGYFQFSLFYYKDLYRISGKANYEMTGLRATAMF